MKTKHAFKVYYNRGLGAPITVEAENPEEARKIALAEYRRGCTEMDDSPLDFVVSQNVEDLGPEL